MHGVEAMGAIAMALGALHLLEASFAVYVAVVLAGEWRRWRRYQTWSAIGVLGGEPTLVFASFTAWLNAKPVCVGCEGLVQWRRETSIS
jgi:hypothetical protein